MKNGSKESTKTAKKLKKLKESKNVKVTPLAPRNGEVKQQDAPELTPAVKIEENETEVSPQKNVFQFMMSSRHKNNGQSLLCAEISINGDSAFEADKKTRNKRGRPKNLLEVKDTLKRKRECEDFEQFDESYGLTEISDLTSNFSDDEALTKKKRASRALVSEDEVEATEKDSRKNKRKWRLKIKLQNVENLVETIISKTNHEEPVVANGDQSESDIDDGNEGNNDTDEKEATADRSSPELLNTVDKVCIRRSLRSRKSVTNYCTSSDDMEDDIVGKKTKKHSKVAPVFLKSLPKPKMDPKVAEAKRLFLLSGVPTVLRKELEKQQRYKKNHVCFIFSAL